MKNHWHQVGPLIFIFVLAVCGCSRMGRFSLRRSERNVGSLTGSEISDDTLESRPLRMVLLPAIMFDNVHFAYDSVRIEESERGVIEDVTDYMRKNSGVGVILEGHCDERGSREYNMSLGERRSLAVRAYLIGLGINNVRIQTRSYGEEKPVALGHDEASWQINRRVQFVFFN